MSSAVHHFIANKVILLAISAIGFIPLLLLHQTKRVPGMIVLYTALVVGALYTVGDLSPFFNVQQGLHGISIAGMGGAFLAFAFRGHGKISRLLARVQREGEVPINAG